MNHGYDESDACTDEQAKAEQDGKHHAVASAYRVPPAVGRRSGGFQEGSRLGPRIIFGVAMALYFGASAPVAVALTHGRVDTFSSGTTEGWVSPVGNPSLPHVVPTGGPAGAGDGYVFVTASGGAPRGELSALNVTQWAGDYVQAGVSAFQMDCWNAGKSALVLRIQISRVSPLGRATDVVVSKPIVLPPGKGWVPVVVSIVLGDLKTLVGDAGLALSGATEVQIVQGPVHAFQGEDQARPPGVSGALGVDNFRVLGVPVPTRPSSWTQVKSVYR